ncbi:hypothetical protein HK101_011745 [Irineochytrium annulatum]|nr:hypothetical protein HK101_011745 [Irineochytrium annulatum]
MMSMYFLGEFKEVREILQEAVEYYGENDIGVTAYSELVMELCAVKIQIGDLVGVKELYLQAENGSPLRQDSRHMVPYAWFVVVWAIIDYILLILARNMLSEGWMKVDRTVILDILSVALSHRVKRTPERAHMKALMKAVTALLLYDSRGYLLNMKKAVKCGQNTLWMVPFYRSRLHAQMVRAARLLGTERTSLSLADEKEFRACFSKAECKYELEFIERIKAG